MIEKQLIEKKLQQVIEYLDELRPIAERISVEEVLKDYLETVEKVPFGVS